MKRTSPGGIASLSRRGGGGEAWLKEDSIFLQRRRAQLRTELPSPDEVPAVGDGPDRFHGEEVSICDGIPRQFAEVREGGEGGSA